MRKRNAPALFEAGSAPPPAKLHAAARAADTGTAAKVEVKREVVHQARGKRMCVAEPDLELEFPVEEQERRTLPNGTEYFGARIIVTNTARETRDVPPILIVLRDGRERIVFSWEVTPPQASLAPGESMTINEAMTDVPKSAVIAEVGWAPR